MGLSWDIWLDAAHLPARQIGHFASASISKFTITRPDCIRPERRLNCLCFVPLTGKTNPIGGVGAIWNKDGVVSIYSDLTPRHQLQDDVPGQANVYHPIAKNESIVDMWLYTPATPGVSDLESSRAIILKTSKGRFLTLGPIFYGSAGHMAFQKAVPDSPTKITALCYNKKAHSTKYSLAEVGAFSESTNSFEFKRDDTMSLPQIMEPPLRNMYPFLTSFTRANLERVAWVDVCRDNHSRFPRVFGLMLHYYDGTRLCVGQWRKNRPIERSCPRPAQMRIRFTPRPSRKALPPFISDIQFVPPHEATQRDPEGWFCWPMNGVVRWWVGENWDLLNLRVESSEE
jgi:hypothetical protein